MTRAQRMLDHVIVAPGTPAALAARDPGWLGGADSEHVSKDEVEAEARRLLVHDVERLA
jgi:hypothetical protein